MPGKKGVPLSPEHRAKISDGNKGKISGVPKSPEHRAKLSAALAGKKLPPEHRASLLAAAKRPKSPEHRARLSEVHRALATTPERQESLRRAQLASQSGYLERVERDGLRPDVRGWFALVGRDLRERDGDLCQLCLRLIDFTIPVRDPFSPSVDHIIPTLAGGSDEMDNFWLAHLRCNQVKSARWAGREDGTTDVRAA